MYIQWNKKGENKNYPTAIIRQSYRENGKSKKRTIANLGKCSIEEIKAIELALKNKGNLGKLTNIKESLKLLTAHQGISFGANWTIYQIAKKLGIEKVLNSFNNPQQAKLALWQIISRIVDQGSRLSAVRMARDEASDEILHFSRSFNEDDLYKNLAWLGSNQEEIENRLFKVLKDKEKPSLFLYDVTSSYLEGVCNELAEWGYSRDKKKGKKQIVIGLLCNEEGTPVSVEVFMGNTSDTSTFRSQIDKVSQRFGCTKITFVGDKGMIKSAQIKNLGDENFHYITSITKPQIKKLVKEGVFQLELFEDSLVEVQHEGIRYILRKNPIRAEEIKQNRVEKESKIKEMVKKQNEHLQDHPKAKITTALKKIENKIIQLKLSRWLSAEAIERNIQIRINDEEKQREFEFDGCYAIKTDLSKEEISAELVHDRYKDLAKVEWAFRTAKTTHLEIRPLYVIKEKSTRGHILICMLAYIIEQELRKAWNKLDVTPEEGLKRLRTLCTTEIKIKNITLNKITKPNKQTDILLKNLQISLPKALPKRKINVDTRKKLTQ